MPRCAVIDSYYPDFLVSRPPLTGTYEQELAKLLAFGFGTADFYSYNLKALGWDAVDIIANHADLQQLWGNANRGHINYGDYIIEKQLETFAPHVVFLQDLSFFRADQLSEFSEKYFLAGQCSCPMPAVANVRQFDVLFTSFPHYVQKFKELGVQAEYLPLAFDDRMLARHLIQNRGNPERTIDIAFVGGLGRSSHWAAGTDAIEAVAKAFRGQFAWWGYKTNLDSLALDECYWGEKWGRDMYEIYGRAKIVINRHGEVAQGYTNNLRCFEATGMGALLITEESSNLRDLFPKDAVVAYRNPADLCDKIRYYLDHEDERAEIAARGQIHTLTYHSYSWRMQRVSEVLKQCLEQKDVLV